MKIKHNFIMLSTFILSACINTGKTTNTNTTTSNISVNDSFKEEPQLTSVPTPAGVPHYKIFKTQEQFDGDFSQNHNYGSIPFADMLCNVDTNRPDQTGHTKYRAIISSSSRKVGQNWVLESNTAYFTATNQYIGTTNDYSIFDFPLFNKLGKSGAWTGLNSDWTTGESCDSWSTKNNQKYGIIGDASKKDYRILNTKTVSCNQKASLYCAEKVVTQSTSSDKALLIFTTTNGYWGNLNGISGADQKCQLDVNCSGKKCKALIVANEPKINSVRYACTKSGVCGDNHNHDWVLIPNQYYKNTAGKIIGLTNNQALFDFPVSGLLSNTNDLQWTGLNSDWTTSNHTCSGWTVGDSGYNKERNGSVGDKNFTSIGTSSCSRKNSKNELGKAHCYSHHSSDGKLRSEYLTDTQTNTDNLDETTPVLTSLPTNGCVERHLYCVEQPN